MDFPFNICPRIIMQSRVLDQQPCNSLQICTELGKLSSPTDMFSHTYFLGAVDTIEFLNKNKII